MEKYYKIASNIKFLLVVLLCSCNISTKEGDMEKWKEEIIKTEHEFARMVLEKGISEAFLEYAAEDAVLLRNNSLIIGKDSIRASFKSTTDSNATLKWKPDFVDVAASGDLGYTYGRYEYITTDSVGNKNVMAGVFHTVWKRQADGSWKFVWD